jgi:hypothetical protein
MQISSLFNCLCLYSFLKSSNGKLLPLSDHGDLEKQLNVEPITESKIIPS